MPPQPKRKYAKARQGERRQHLKIVATALQDCPQCHSKMQPHHVCTTCGYYAGREVVAIESPAEKKAGKKKE
jgi:large subunit ribosomal protein L32